MTATAGYDQRPIGATAQATAGTGYSWSVRVIVPQADAATLMGGPPTGVELLLWRGDDFPGGAGDAAVLVPPWWATSQQLERLHELPGLKLVQTLGAGYDWVVDAVPPGVQLANNPGVNARPVAEWVLTAILTSLRGFPEFCEDQRDRRWNFHETGELGGNRVLVIGYGAIGKRIAALLTAFEAEVAVAASRRRAGVAGPEDIPGLLGWAEVVVVMVPLDTSTRHLVDSRFLAGMRNGALLVNGSRGGVVDTDALTAELETGRIRAVLDVTDPEPLPPEHILWHAPGVLITPHVASAVPSFLPASYRRVRTQLERLQRGEPPDHVVPTPH